MTNETKVKWRPEEDRNSIIDAGAETTTPEGGASNLNLFKATGVRHPDYWQCIRYIAPTEERKKWTYRDATGVYCIECQTTIKYHPVKNNKGVKRHMEKYHPELLDNFKGGNMSSKKRKGHSHIEDHLPTSGGNKKSKKTTMASGGPNQAKLNEMVALWTAGSLRPCSICEDSKLQEIIDFASEVKGQLKMPSRFANKKYILDIYRSLKERILAEINAKCESYSCTSDMWSSRSMKAFMALTLHFVTEEFKMRSYTLAIKPVLGKNTAEMIGSEMQSCLLDWNLDQQRMAMMMRDSGSNTVKACNDIGIPHFPCIAHSLHLIVGPFLVLKKTNATPSDDSGQMDAEEQQEATGGAENNAEEAEPVDSDALLTGGVADNNESVGEEGVTEAQGHAADTDNYNVDEEAEDGFADCFDEELSENEVVTEICELVQAMRKFTAYVKNSTKAIGKLERLQKDLFPRPQVLKVKSDVRTRWNSTLAMLLRLVQLRDPINEFLLYYNSAQGKKEFKWTKTKLGKINDENWALLGGLCYLLGCFKNATVLLQGESYSTFISVLPVLRKIKSYISNPNMFKYRGQVNLSKVKQQYYEQYGKMAFFESVTSKLEICRKLLLKQFNKRFASLDIKVLWTSLLDPRFGLSSPHWKDDAEKERAKKYLTDEVEALAVEENEAEEAADSIVGEETEPFGSAIEDQSLGGDDFDFSFADLNPTTVRADKAKTRQNMMVHVKNEVQSYLLERPPKKGVCTAEWWNVIQPKYPLVAKVARKWLSVPATSAPSERVLSVCGIVDTQRRNWLQDESVKAQVFVHNNYHRVNEEA